MHNPLIFFRDLLRQPAWIPLWVSWLAGVNLFSAYFWSEPVARVVLVVFLASATLMMLLYARFGFEKILGLGHVLWLPLLPFLLASMRDAHGSFRAYLYTLCASIAISLAFDVTDVWKHFRAGARPDR